MVGPGADLVFATAFSPDVLRSKSLGIDFIHIYIYIYIYVYIYMYVYLSDGYISDVTEF